MDSAPREFSGLPLLLPLGCPPGRANYSGSPHPGSFCGQNATVIVYLLSVLTGVTEGWGKSVKTKYLVIANLAITPRVVDMINNLLLNLVY